MPPSDVATAKGVCARCPVVRQCLVVAIAMDERWGIWGGLTTQERKRLIQAHDGQAGAMAAVAGGCPL